MNIYIYTHTYIHTYICIYIYIYIDSRGRARKDALKQEKEFLEQKLAGRTTPGLR